MVAASDAHHKTRKREEKKRQTEDAAMDGRTNERTNECWRGESASCCCSFIICNQQKGAVGHVSLLLLCWSLRDCVCAIATAGGCYAQLSS